MKGLPWWSSVYHSAPSAEDPGSFPGQGTRSHMLQLRVHMQQLKIQHATAKTQHSQINKLTD